MAGFDAQSLAEIKARVNLADLIAEYGVDVRRVGDGGKACCPFHKEKTPSFNINGREGFYKCFGCGVSGDAFTFVMEMEGLTFADAVRKLADRAGVKLETRYDPQAKVRARLHQICQELAAFYRRCLLQTREAARAREYLQSRDLLGDIAETFGIGFAPENPRAILEWARRHGFSPDELVAAGVLAPPRRPGDDYYDRFRGRIAFPICDVQGRVVAFSCRLLEERKHAGKYVNSPETDLFKKSNTLYALHLARAAIVRATPRRAIVCEGQIDVIRCHACGFPVAVASQGTAFTAEHVALLAQYADTADLVFDGDKAGIKAALRTMGLFMAKGIPVRLVSLPPGEDPDSLLRTQGADAFRACLDRAEDPAPYLVRRLREQEAAPDAMDAVMRIAKAAVAAAVDCPKPVMTAKFLNDVAEALHLPPETLHSDLESLRADAAEAERRRAEWRQRQEAAPKSGSAAQAVETNAFQEAWEDADEELVETPFDPNDEALPPEAPPATFDLEASHNLARALCELIVHHFPDGEVMDCLLRHLPPAFVHNPYAAKLYAAAREAALAKHAVLSPPKDDPGFLAYLETLCVSADRLLAAGDDITPLSYARDLVRRYWMREYARLARQADPASPEAFLLTQSRKRLQTLSWEAAAPFMDAKRPPDILPSARNAPPAAPANPPAPPAAKEPSDVPLAAPPPEPEEEIEDWLPADSDAEDVYGSL